MALVAAEEAAQDWSRTDQDGRADAFSFVDHLSRFSGLAVAQLYLLCAAVTVYEVIARYVYCVPQRGRYRQVTLR